jgi:hypothetical protein
MYLLQLCLIRKSKIKVFFYSGLVSYYQISLICHLCFEVGPNHIIRNIPPVRINDESMDVRSEQVDSFLTQILQFNATSVAFHYKITFLPHKREMLWHLWLLTHSLTHSWSWALLEKLSIVQPLKNFPAFYRTRRLITAFTRAFHGSLSSARSIQSIPSHPF